jgi:hypothetical protein
MRKIGLFILSMLLLIGAGANGCDKDSPEENSDKITPCDDLDLQDKKVIEIKDLQTKLYFLRNYAPGVIIPYAEIFPSEGIGYRGRIGVFKYPNLEGKSISCDICNFPDYAVNWNQKDKTEDASVEDKFDIVVNGKIHISVEWENYIRGTLVLTSLKKK